MIKSWIRNAAKKKRNTGQSEANSRHSQLPAVARLCGKVLIAYSDSTKSELLSTTEQFLLSAT
jgi:hypothetical protein